MVDQALRHDLMAKVEGIFDSGEEADLHMIQQELADLGFVQKAGDAATIRMEHEQAALVLEIELDESGSVHGYELLPREEWGQKQERFRW
jgi:hypothetical protein